MRIDSLTNPIINKFGYIGSTAATATVVDLDITDELRGTDGKLVAGMHTLYFNSQSVSPNTDGLGIIGVSHKVIVKTSDANLSPLPTEA
jgi:hypothetical protein